MGDKTPFASKVEKENLCATFFCRQPCVWFPQINGSHDQRQLGTGQVPRVVRNTWWFRLISLLPSHDHPTLNPGNQKSWRQRVMCTCRLARLPTSSHTNDLLWRLSAHRCSIRYCTVPCIRQATVSRHTY